MPGRAKSGGGEGAEAAASADAEVLGLRAASSRSSSAEFNEYLRKQAHLLDLRIADHPFEKAHLRVRRWQDRAQIAVLGGLAALLAALTVLIAGMTVKAVTAHDIVVEPFTVAPELAARGLTGAVVAQHVLDQVAAIDQATVSTLQGPARYRDGREEPIKIEIPETGVSLSDLDRYLRRWLGHETHVSGEVVRSGAGYELSVRLGDQAVAPVHSQGEDIAPLVKLAAEGIFRTARPVRFADYLSAQGRYGEAWPLLVHLSGSGPREQRAVAFSGLAALLMSSGQLDKALEKARAADRLAPQNGAVKGWLASVEWLQGNEEAALHHAEQAARDWPQVGDDSEFAPVSRAYSAYFRIVAAERRRDYRTALEGFDRLEADGDIVHLFPSMRYLQRAIDAAALHDDALARRILSAGREDGLTPLPSDQGELSIAYYAGDPAAVMAIGRRVVAASRPNPADRVQTANFWFPGISEAFAATGDIGAAQALAAEFGPACDRCRVARGTIARDSGDWGAAQAWYRRAQAAAPSLADADLAWGQALLARNDPDGAIAHARAAHAKSPKWAEPLLLWGEALAAKRDPAAALAQYRAAEALAPKWGRIQLRMGQALAAKGDASRASQRLAEAARRELSPDDRAELDRILLKTP